MGASAVELRSITDTDIPAVAEFLHRELNPRVSVDGWTSSIVPPWSVEAPNHGYHLVHEGRVVGVHLAFYSERVIDGQRSRICNLAAWCVIEEHRHQGIRLLRALLKQPGYTFTDLSPSGNVIEVNRRLRFSHLDTTTTLSVNLGRRRGVSITCSAHGADGSALLDPATARIYDDHRHAGAALQLVVEHQGRTCLVVLRRDRRKGLPLFATVLYVSDPELFRDCSSAVLSHLLTNHHIPLTLAELRVVGTRPPRSVLLKRSRPKMFRSSELRADQIDDLYSELTCVTW